MKYFWLFITLFNLFALIVFLVRQDFGALPFATAGVIVCGINTILDFKEDENE